MSGWRRLLFVTMNSGEQLLKEREEDRLELEKLEVSGEEVEEAAKAVNLGLGRAWGNRTTYGTFKPYYDPPRYGSIHYWLAYAREVLFEARRRKAFKCEVRCAMIGLGGFAGDAAASVHTRAAKRILDELEEINRGYSRLK